jgi:hypothetical protein
MRAGGIFRSRARHGTDNRQAAGGKREKASTNLRDGSSRRKPAARQIDARKIAVELIKRGGAPE